MGAEVEEEGEWGEGRGGEEREGEEEDEGGGVPRWRVRVLGTILPIAFPRLGTTRPAAPGPRYLSSRGSYA